MIQNKVRTKSCKGFSRRRRRNEACMRGFVFCLHTNVTAASPLSMSVWMEAKRWPAPLSILLVMLTVRVSYSTLGAVKAYAEFFVHRVVWLAVDSVRCGLA